MRARIVFAALLTLPASAFADDAAPAIGLLDVRPAEATLAKDAARTRQSLESGLRQFRVRVLGDHPAVAAAHLDRAVYPGSMIKVYDEVKAQILHAGPV